VTTTFRESLAHPEDILPGDFVQLAGDLGWREVADVEENLDGSWTVSYLDLVLNSWDYGSWRRTYTTAARPFVKELRKLFETDLWPVRKVS
jgi:hypothetical protein